MISVSRNLVKGIVLVMVCWSTLPDVFSAENAEPNTYLVDFSGSCPEPCQCSKDLTTVDCSNRRLKAVPNDIPSQVKILNLDKNGILDLPVGVFSNLIYLTTLYLRNNLLITIQIGAFQNLPVLTDLYFTNNKISNLTSEMFKGIGSLTFLSLGANKLRSIPDLSSLPSLKKLVLEANNLQDVTFPPGFANLHNLNTVVLSNNPDVNTVTNDTFASLAGSPVTSLEISRCSLKNISSGALKPLRTLSSLKIGYNPLDNYHLENLLEGLRDNMAFHSLDLSNINLAGELPSLAALSHTKLSTLIFKSNGVMSIPANAFANLTELVMLDLSANKIQSVSDSAFTGLTKLQRLFFNDNKQLGEVPRNLPSSLTQLNLIGNSIQQIKNNAFSQLKNLQLLYLANNQITQVSEDSFLGLNNLKTLHLNANKLNTVPKRLFRSLTRLEDLNLKNNNFKTLANNSGVFQFQTSLLILNLAGNLCSYIPYDYFSELESLQSLHLEDNLLNHAVAGDYTGKFFYKQRKLQYLSLANNELQYINDLEFRNLNQLQRLDLSNNQLSAWGPSLFHTLSKTLQTLDLSQNHVSLINQTSVQDLGGLQVLNLTNNPFACTCDLLFFRNWLNNNTVNITGAEKYTCNSPPEWNGHLLLSFTSDKIQCVSYLWYYVGGACAVGVLVTALAATLIYRNRWFIGLRLYRIGKKFRRAGPHGAYGGYEEIDGRGREFDFYLISSEEDQEFVRTRLLPRLDNGQGYGPEERYQGHYKLYVEDRDALPNRHRIASCELDMPSCRSVLVALTPNLSRDPWCHFLLVMAKDHKEAGTVNSIVIIMVGRVGPRHIPDVLERQVRSHDFIEWPNPDTAEQDFLERLDERLNHVHRRERGENQPLLEHV